METEGGKVKTNKIGGEIWFEREKNYYSLFSIQKLCVLFMTITWQV